MIRVLEIEKLCYLDDIADRADCKAIYPSFGKGLRQDYCSLWSYNCIKELH